MDAAEVTTFRMAPVILYRYGLCVHTVPLGWIVQEDPRRRLLFCHRMRTALTRRQDFPRAAIRVGLVPRLSRCYPKLEARGSARMISAQVVSRNSREVNLYRPNCSSTDEFVWP